MTEISNSCLIYYAENKKSNAGTSNVRLHEMRKEFRQYLVCYNSRY